MPLEVSVGHVQIISTGVGQAFLQLVLPLIYHVYHRSELDPFFGTMIYVIETAVQKAAPQMIWEIIQAHIQNIRNPIQFWIVS